MYARSTTLTADPARMDDGIADIRDDVMPAVLEMDGCVGLSMLCDRDSGRCIVTTAWESEEAMAATRERVRSMRDRAVRQFGGHEPEVREWEIATVHRAHAAGDGACARVIWSRLHDTAQIDRVIEAWKAAILPRLDETDGFCSVSLMVDRAQGRGVSTVTFDSREAMDSSREMGDRMRDEFSSRMPVDITEVAEMDLVIHHLRVPELV
ncbi:antibiotic biosynthesis monooxygenase [Blastococcus sp. VKM Ac-2987]|uniref:antibiotic biosynthesis monooxygenase n=1 Tax=Blastococcus sp. VKM Ac-2987 TaxID=3004141 RepID=UPI0022ABA8E7|nr:antibiotic biosynthesis monooxygenase [Blastococcus sp. VKM Ac-2987]MCZ2859972.1 antibiotic biosynthesis monooxygenase [Blastococcus sp. VKM Ac-2987]